MGRCALQSEHTSPELRFEVDAIEHLQAEAHSSGCRIDACFGDSAGSAGRRRLVFRRAAAPTSAPATAASRTRTMAPPRGCVNAPRHGGRHVVTKVGKVAGGSFLNALRVGGGRGVKRSRIGIGSCNRHGLGYPRAERVRVAVERSSESQAAEELQTHFLRARGDVTVGAREVPDDTGGQRLGSVNECAGDRDPVPACGIV